MTGRGKETGTGSTLFEDGNGVRSISSRETLAGMSLTYKLDGQFDTIKRFANSTDDNPLIQTTHQYDGKGRLTGGGRQFGWV